MQEWEYVTLPVVWERGRIPGRLRPGEEGGWVIRLAVPGGFKQFDLIDGLNRMGSLGYELAAVHRYAEPRVPKEFPTLTTAPPGGMYIFKRPKQ